MAADAVHDAFVQVWKNASSFDAERGNASAWLTGIVRYRAIDITKPRMREKLIPELPDQEDETPDALARLIGISEAAALHRSLALLKPDRRQMLISAYVDGLSREQIATKYGVPLGTAKSWIRRALAQLKCCLEHKELPEPWHQTAGLLNDQNSHRIRFTAPADHRCDRAEQRSRVASAAFEGKAPDRGLRVVTRHEYLSWSLEKRARHAAEFGAGLPKHQGLTVVIPNFGETPAAKTAGTRAIENVSSHKLRRHLP